MADHDSLTEAVLRKQPEYLEKVPYYEFLAASYIGGPTYLNPDNLFPHIFEDSPLYNQRMRRAYFYNYSSPIVNAYQSFLYREPVKRDYGTLENEPLFQEFLNNADKKNNSYEEIVRDAAKWSSTLGITYWLIDKPSETAPNKGEEIEQSLYPYIVPISPVDIPDWSLDKHGNLDWVKIREISFDSDDFKDAPKKKERYRIWYKDRWELYEIRHDSGKKAQKAELVGEGPHPVGEVPLVQIVHYSDRPMSGLSLLSDIAFVNRALFNHCSLLDEILYRQTFSQFIFPNDPANPQPEIEMGTAKGIGFPIDSSHPPSFISPDPGQAAVLMAQIQAGVEEIYRLATLRGAIGVTEQSSGVARSFDFMITNNTLSNKALNMENAEMKALEFWAKWQEESDPEIQISYPRDFDITSLEDEIANVLQVETLKIGKTFGDLLKKQIVKKMLPRLGDDDMEKIEKEIEEGAKPEVLTGLPNQPPLDTGPPIDPDNPFAADVDNALAGEPTDEG